jgi:hypothetical protein
MHGSPFGKGGPFGGLGGGELEPISFGAPAGGGQGFFNHGPLQGLFGNIICATGCSSV